MMTESKPDHVRQRPLRQDHGQNGGRAARQHRPARSGVAKHKEIMARAEPLQRAEKGERPLRSLYGLWKDFGVSISAEEIDAARRELWGNLPQQDT
jgi:hypothetical protein